VLPNGAPDPNFADSNQILLNIPRNWNDSIGIRVGPGYWVSEETEFFGSFGVTTPAAPKTTIDAATIDAFRLNFAVGARHEFSKRFALGVSYNHVHLLPVDTKNTNQHDTFAQPSRSPSGDGRYTGNIFFVNANATITF
jgi:long-subunit fatty acid transport protein